MGDGRTNQALRLDFSNVSNERLLITLAGMVWLGPDDLSGIDLSSYSSLVFYIRGATGGEEPNIYLMMPIIDGNFQRFWKDIEQETPVITLWQRVVIPLSHFTSS